MGDDTLYRLKSGAFSPRAAAGLTRALETYDALLCVGQMGSDLAREVLGDGAPPRVLTIHPVVGRTSEAAVASPRPDLDGTNVVVIAHGPSAQRAWSKGLDLALQAFARARQARPELTLTVVGEWDPTYVDELLATLPPLGESVSFIGARSDLTPVLRSASLCVQLARGEAFGMSVMEAMAAGVPCLVSDWTGAKEIVGQVDQRLVVPLDVGAAAERMGWYFGLPLPKKTDFSDTSRRVVAGYSDERALAEFAEAIAAAVAL
jgi:glycosyltransferase involved in cell wall biosynthesis